MLVMQDEAGEDAKIICVPPNDPRWDEIRDIEDLSPSLRAEIRHFFDVYKLIEPGKQSETRDFEGREAAWTEIEAARQRASAPG
jgi:inorganic pyrophosphatase